jgi:serine/threonine-protein kinase
MSPSSRYTILRKIADGGTAEIFLAKQHGAQGFEKSVVLKRIFTNFYADPQFRHMLVDEAHVAMTLNHSNIVQVLDLGEAEGRYFLALELVDGWTLDRILRRSKAAGVPFPPALALYVTAEVCRALAYAHNKKRPDGTPLGVVHRDISPHNVLISEQGEVKITDFGIAKAQTRKEKSLGNLIKGKIAFMSPEQGSGEPLDARSDIFSTGTMLYVMITRRHPFDAPTDYETLMLVKAGDFMPPETARPGLNPETYRVIRKAMAKSAGDRYQAAEEMLVDVERVMRVAFRPVGQTELQRWLADLASKDGVRPLTREAPPEPAGGSSTVGPLRAGDGQESGLVLSLDDAVEVRSADRPPPPPAAPTEVMTRPPPFVAADRPWLGRRAVRIGGAAALIALFVVALKVMRGGSHATPPTVPAPPTTQPIAAAPPSPAPPAQPTTPAQPVQQPTAAAPAPSPSSASATAAPAAQPAPTEPSADASASKAAPAAAAPTPPPAEQPPVAEEHPAPSGAADTDEKASGDAAKPRRSPFPVLIKSDPDGSRVATGRHVFGTTPLTLRLRPGNSYELTFTKAGYAPVTRRYRFEDEQSQTLRITLKKLPEAKKPATTTAAKPAASPPPPPPAQKKGWFGR